MTTKVRRRLTVGWLVVSLLKAFSSLGPCSDLKFKRIPKLWCSTWCRISWSWTAPEPVAQPEKRDGENHFEKFAKLGKKFCKKNLRNRLLRESWRSSPMIWPWSVRSWENPCSKTFDSRPFCQWKSLEPCPKPGKQEYKILGPNRFIYHFWSWVFSRKLFKLVKWMAQESIASSRTH